VNRRAAQIRVDHQRLAVRIRGERQREIHGYGRFPFIRNRARNDDDPARVLLAALEHAGQPAESLGGDGARVRQQDQLVALVQSPGNDPGEGDAGHVALRRRLRGARRLPCLRLSLEPMGF